MRALPCRRTPCRRARVIAACGARHASCPGRHTSAATCSGVMFSGRHRRFPAPAATSSEGRLPRPLPARHHLAVSLVTHINTFTAAARREQQRGHRLSTDGSPLPQRTSLGCARGVDLHQTPVTTMPIFLRGLPKAPLEVFRVVVVVAVVARGSCGAVCARCGGASWVAVALQRYPCLSGAASRRVCGRKSRVLCPTSSLGLATRGSIKQCIQGL